MVRFIAVFAVLFVGAQFSLYAAEESSKKVDSEESPVANAECESRRTERAYLSQDRQHIALFSRLGNSLFVKVDGTDYGPFEDSDMTSLSPFRFPSGHLSFRATRSGSHVLVAHGKTYGPFDEIWPPMAAGSHWGTLVKKGAKYHVLVDGVLSAGFDEIAGDHRGEQFDLQRQFELDVPLFYASNHWAFFARTDSALFIVTDQKTHGPFQAISGQQFNTPPDELFPAELRRSLSFDKSTCAVGISKKSETGDATHSLWIDGVEHGPFPELPAFAAIRDMSMDGDHWGFSSAHHVHSSRGSFEAPSATSPSLSDNGETLAYSFRENDDYHIVVNGHDSGPFDRALPPSVSPDGSRWICEFSRANEDDSHLLTESGELGPYRDIKHVGFAGGQWLAVTANGDGTLSAIIEGQAFGPYSGFSAPLQPGFRTHDKSWRAHGYKADGVVDVIDTGKLLASTGPFKSISELRVKSPHWSARGDRDDGVHIIEDGRISAAIGPFAHFVGYYRSSNAARLAVRGKDANGKYWIAFRTDALGPYDANPLRFEFSSNGQRWGFTVVASNGKIRAIHDQGESADYEEIIGWAMTERGPVFVGRTGEQSWLHVGSESHGPFDAAGVAIEGQKIFGVSVSGDEVNVSEY